MRFSASLLLASLVLSALAKPYWVRQETDPTDPTDPGGADGDGDGDDDTDADGNAPDLGDGNGIPDVSNATNPQCVPFYGVRDAILGGIFQGRCGDSARAAVRLAFHDAGTFSLQLQALGLPTGAADGSMIWDPTEVTRTENNGLQTIVGILAPLPAQLGVSPGDILHLAGVLGVLACPGGPRVDAFVGRGLPLNTAPTGRLPNPDDPVPLLLAKFADMSFSVRSMVALIGAHTSGKQRFVDPARNGSSFDSTVDIWDVDFYGETVHGTPDSNVFMLDSDVNIAGNTSTRAEFHRYINNQPDWDEDYRAAHFQMSTLGYNVTTLINCTEIMPASINLTTLTINGTVDPTLLEAATQKYRAPWLVPSS
ncbi:heme peroxidase [Mycena alexandri]|uniref:Peroxidase n=1 Tax=Mycena alexandri TaxID=1745969 RepID=A0AAD6SYS9_9AGAR|nr:heme peroxidase [Mycena alexandri]